MIFSSNILIVRIVRFYAEGFRSMQIGRTLWMIILLKLFVMFAILKVFFFPAFLQGTDEQKGERVSHELTERIAQ